MIDYPNKLNIIFEKLDKFDIKPIIVGGYIRDALLKNESKDIDIELYGVSSLESVEKILQEFGSVNSVGKSFGVCKLSYKQYDLDFSLPREDSKFDSGHKGFKVTTDANLDYTTAASRRDFTINSMGYDVKNNLLLDPFHGREDLKSKTLRAVDIEKFDEDPLRVLRAVQFSTRFHLNFDVLLFSKCKNMIQKGLLKELPRERIFNEFKKMFLKSDNPSEGIFLLKKLGAFNFFEEFETLKNVEFETTIKSIDLLDTKESISDAEKITLTLALLCRNFTQENRESFLNKLTHELKQKLFIEKIIFLMKTTEKNTWTNFDIYSLAKEVEVRVFLLFMHAAFLGEKDDIIKTIRLKAKTLNVYTAAMPPLIEGKDLIAIGLKPSKKFSSLLRKSYIAQMQEVFKNKKDALIWIKENLIS